MEDIYLSFPHIFENILSNLDDQSLANCRLVNKTLQWTIDNGKIIWVRIIQRWISDSIIQKWISDARKHYQNETKSLWKFVMEKAPTKVIQQLAKAVF